MNELIILENLTPAVVFSAGGGDPIVDKIRKEVLSVDRDISTEEGRKHVASLAYKVAKSKTFLDEMGKTFAADLKKQTKAIDGERARIWDALEALQKEVRKPLTEFEEKEKLRIERHEANLAEIIAAGEHAQVNWESLSVEAMKDRINEISAPRDWEEFSARAKEVIEQAVSKTNQAIAKKEKHEAEQAELAKLRAEAAAREQKEREDRIAKEAADRARKDAEEKAEAERKAIEKAVKDAEGRERKALEAKEAAEKKAIADAKAAEERAAREKEAAIKAERDRVEAQKKAEEEAARKREADKKHRAAINNEAASAIKKVLESATNDDMERLIVSAIAKGEVPHVKIFY